MARRRSRRPFDAWDPYRDDPDPPFRRRWSPRRLWRLSVPTAFGLLVFSHDIIRLFEPDRPAPVAEAQISPPRPFTRDVSFVPKAVPPDPRTALPRPAKPVEPPASWFTSNDYPSSALGANLAGTVRFRFTIEPDGRVRDCAPISTSNSPLLDATACGVYLQHARYWPARDGTGRAIAQAGTEKVIWKIPKD